MDAGSRELARGATLSELYLTLAVVAGLACGATWFATERPLQFLEQKLERASPLGR